MQFAAAESLQPAELGDISEANRRVDNQHAQRFDREMGQHWAQERERDQHGPQRRKGHSWDSQRAAWRPRRSGRPRCRRA
jgi:hypothetical protein